MPDLKEVAEVSLSRYVAERNEGKNPSSEVVTKKTEAKPSATADESTRQVETASASETDTTQETKEEDEEAAPKPKGGWQRRIDKQTKRITQLNETLEEERLARQRLEAQLAGKPAGTALKTAADEDPEPDENSANPKTGKSWTDWKEFNRAHAAWSVRQELKTQSAGKEQRESEQSGQEQLRQNFDAHQARLRTAPEKFEDWDEVVETLKGEAVVPEAVSMAIIKLKNSDEVLYHLAKNPDLIKSLREMDDLDAIMELGHISKSLKSSSKKTEGQEQDNADGKSKESPETSKPQSTAPAPIKPVSGSSARSTVNPEKMKTSEYIRLRNLGQLR